MERIFSVTNALASVTRYVSPYRRRLYIEAFLRQVDKDKYLNCGTFILNNYKQALDIIHNDNASLQEAMRSLAVTEEDLDRWEAEEITFFSHVGEEDPYDIHAVAYVQLLQELRDLDDRRQAANAQFLTFVPAGDGSSYTHDLSITRRIETEHRHANEQFSRVHEDVCALEVQMGISVRWVPTTPKYVTAVKYTKERQYHRALGKLQKLVTQRLFELQRLNVAHTGK
jgi:hypothetical protein